MLRVVVIGLGPIGTGCARAVLAESGLALAGLVDTDPNKLGLVAASLNGPEDDSQEVRHAGPLVTDDLDEAIAGDVDVAIVATSSYLQDILPLVEKLLSRGIAVISSCEQLVWPWYAHADAARRIDEAAKAGGKAVLGVGVNPGFVMDMLAVTLASMVRRVTSVRCVRRVNTSLRRPSLQRRVGAGLTKEEFDRLAPEGMLGAVGLAESACILAAGLGRHVQPGSVHERFTPVLAEQPTASSFGLIRPGEVCGTRQQVTWEGEGLSLDLDLTMAVGLTDSVDKVAIEGPVQLCLKIPNAIPGDSSTVAALLNHLRVIHNASPGLHTLLDLPPSGCCNSDR